MKAASRQKPGCVEAKQNAFMNSIACACMPLCGAADAFRAKAGPPFESRSSSGGTATIAGLLYHMQTDVLGHAYPTTPPFHYTAALEAFCRVLGASGRKWANFLLGPSEPKADT